MSPDRASRHGLDALSFFIADVQTGFGPFISIYLATSGWSDGAIGAALSVGTVTAMVSQLPGGALVDRLGDKRWAAGGACVVVAIAALLFALTTATPAIMLAEVLHSFGSAMLGPAVAAVSLAAVGRAALGERLGRNARFAAIGNASAAAILAAAGRYLSSRSVFWLTAAFMVPGMVALRFIAPRAATETSGKQNSDEPAGFKSMLALFADKRVLAFGVCVALYHLGNAALLPLASAELSRSLGSEAFLVVAASVVVPQAIVALISPSVGRLADIRGPRLVVACGFAAVPARALLLASVSNPYLIVAVQALDGLGAATFGVMVPLIAADLTRGTGRFNLCLGAFGLATAAGATLSTSLAGAVADHHGESAAFLALSACGLACVVAAWMTSPRQPASRETASQGGAGSA